MSNVTENSRNPEENRRRRSRGGSNNRNNQKGNRRGGDRENRNSRDNRNSNSNRSEEFRPQGPRPPRGGAPVKLSWWQKLLKAIGLYKPPTAPARRFETPKSTQTEPRPAKSNIRNARTNEGPPAEKPEGRPRRENRGGDRSSVESPRVYVGNLSYDVTEQDLQELFKGIGPVRNVEIVYNRTTHRSKGFGFVEMLHMDEAIRTVEVLHDQPFMGRKLIVSGAKSKGQDEREEREDRPERAPRPVAIAPIPVPAAKTEAVTPAVAADSPAPTQTAEIEDEPVIQTVVETVTHQEVKEDFTPGHEAHTAPKVEAVL